MKLRLHYFFAGLLLLVSQLVSAQVKFSAYASPRSIGKHEMTQVDFTVENPGNVEQIMPPAFKGFTVVSGPNQSTSYRSINGVNTSAYTISYVLKPERLGNFAIGAATAMVDGKTYKSNSLQIEVTAEAQGNSANSPFSALGTFDPFEEMIPERAREDYILREGETVEEKIKKNLFIKVITDKQSVYVGQPIVATYKIYTRLKSESKIVQNPSLNGFSVIDMQEPLLNYFTTEQVNGKLFNVYLLRKVQLYPLQSGQLELESAGVENSIRFVKESYIKNLRTDIPVTIDALPAEAIVEKRATVQSNPLTITVKELPAQNKPDSFSGAVGNFMIRAKVEKDKLTTDDAGRLLVAITGSGNMTLLTSPAIAWPKGIDAFEPKASEELNKADVPVSGTRYFDYAFALNEAGSYTIPPIAFTYFDVTTKNYKTIRTEPIPITVAMGTGRPKDTTVVSQGGDERFFNKLFANRWWVAGPIILLILGGLFLWVSKENKKDKQRKEEEQRLAAIAVQEAAAAEQVVPKPVNWLEAAGEQLALQNAPAFYQALNSGLRNFLLATLQIPVAELNKKSIADGLDKKGIHNDTSVQLLQLLGDIEWQLYTPFAEPSAMQQQYNDAAVLIEKIQYQ